MSLRHPVVAVGGALLVILLNTNIRRFKRVGKGEGGVVHRAMLVIFLNTYTYAHIYTQTYTYTRIHVCMHKQRVVVDEREKLVIFLNTYIHTYTYS